MHIALTSGRFKVQSSKVQATYIVIIVHVHKEFNILPFGTIFFSVEEPRPAEGEEAHLQPGPISKKLAKLGQEVGGARREMGGVRSRRKVERGKEKGPEGLMITPEQARAIYSAYEPLDSGVEKEEPVVPIV